MGHNLVTKNKVHKNISHCMLKFKLKLKIIPDRKINDISITMAHLVEDYYIDDDIDERTHAPTLRPLTIV